MKYSGNPLLSFAAPLLVALALVGFLQRDGKDRVHALPSLLVGSGLIINGAIRRSRRRIKLLQGIRKVRK